MKKCNSVIFLFLFLISFVGLLTMLNVKATDDANISGIGDDYKGGSSGSVEGGGGQSVPGGNGSWQISDINGNLKNIYGIRISFVNSLGKNLGSVDYIDGDIYPRIFQGLRNSNSLPDASINIVSNRCSKVGYASGDSNCKYSWTSVNKRSKPSTYFRSLDEFIEYFSNIKLEDNSYYSFNNASSSILNSVIPKEEHNYNYSTIFKFLNKELNLENTKDQEIIYKLFERLFDNIKSNANDKFSDYNKISNSGNEELFDLFLVFEPVTIYAIKGNFYIGTAYELAAEAYKNSFSGSNTVSKLKLP